MEDNEIIRLLWERSECFFEAPSGEHCGAAGFSCEGAD